MLHFFFLFRMGNVPDRWSRRLLRIAVHSRDIVRIRHLNNKGIDINMIISDVFCDTALTYSVKYGYLEIVEILAFLPSCRIDQLDRNNHSALDEAIKAWLVGAVMPSEVRPNLGRRFRIIRCLLESGARQLSVNFLDMVVFSTLSSPGGFELIGKLVRLFCEKGCVHVKSALLSVIVFYKGTASMISSLVASAALPFYYMKKNPAQLSVPMDNALVILRACAQVEILRRIDVDTSSSFELIEKHWRIYSKILRIFTLAGYPLQMFVLNYLYRCHADIYRWVVQYNTNPKPLLHLARNTIRKQIASNVSFALTSLDSIPESMKLYLLYSDV